MIGLLRGRIGALDGDRLVIDVGGVGYVVHAGSHLTATLTPGAETELHVETILSDNAISLFGFASLEDRSWFLRLRGVPGVGARLALAVIDALGSTDLASAVATGDVAAIRGVKGVGRKLAERIVSEFAGQAPVVAGAPQLRAPNNARAAAISALVNLGYGRQEALRAVDVAAREAPDEAGMIRQALKILSG